MTYEIPLNFGRTRVVDPCNGMTALDFSIVAYRNFGLDFWISSGGELAGEYEHRNAVNYYFNLWGDTLKHDNKTGKAHNFDAFMYAILEGNC